MQKLDRREAGERLRAGLFTSFHKSSLLACALLFAALTPALGQGPAMEFFTAVNFGTGNAMLADGMFHRRSEVVNGTDASSDAQALRAVNDQIVTAHASNPEVAHLSDAQKQGQAELMGTFAMLSAAVRDEYTASHNDAGLQQLRTGERAAAVRHRSGTRETHGAWPGYRLHTRGFRVQAAVGQADLRLRAES